MSSENTRTEISYSLSAGQRIWVNLAIINTFTATMWILSSNYAMVALFLLVAAVNLLAADIRLVRHEDEVTDESEFEESVQDSTHRD